MEELQLTTSSGNPINLHLFRPRKSNGKLLLVNSATGVKQQMYFSFANFFCEKGFTVITYDYSGIGLSKPKNFRNNKSSMRSWGSDDYRTVTAFIRKNWPDYRKFCVGHSVGALIFGMNRDSEMFEKLVFVGAQDAYIGNLPPRVALTAILGFGIALPVLAAFLGYFPANWFGLGETLPKNVALDWRTLVMNPKSTSKLLTKSKERISEKLNQETLVVYAEDDPWVKMKGMESLLNRSYPNLKTIYREVKISESPKKTIGHINFFRTYNKNLWNIILDFLNN